MWQGAQTSDPVENPGSDSRERSFCISSLVPEAFIGLFNHIFPLCNYYHPIRKRCLIGFQTVHQVNPDWIFAYNQVNWLNLVFIQEGINGGRGFKDSIIDSQHKHWLSFTNRVSYSQGCVTGKRVLVPDSEKIKQNLKTSLLGNLWPDQLNQNVPQLKRL